MEKKIDNKIRHVKEILYNLFMVYSDSETLFPIRQLAEKSGVAAATLRAWERRYGLLQPRRTASGHRLYGAEDLALVQRINELLADGWSIGALAKRFKDQTGNLVAADAVAETADAWQGYQQQCLRAVRDFSPGRLDAVFNETTALYPLELVMTKLIEPVFDTLGQAWQTRPLGIGEEHFFSHWIRARLEARFQHALPQARGSTLVCSCVPGVRHEIGSLLLALALLGRGYRVVYLGADMPLSQLPGIVRQVAAKALVLSASWHEHVDELAQELAHCASAINVPTYLGGAQHPAGPHWAASLGMVDLGSDLPLGLHQLQRLTPP